MTEDKKLTEAEAISNLIRQPTIEDIYGMPVLILPSGDGAWSHVELNHLLENPLRKKGTVIIHDVDSFIKFTKDEGSLTNTRIYLDVNYVSQKINATSVFNDHGENAGWRDYKATFVPRIGEEWRRWNEKNKTEMSQEQFANFLQDNIGDINNGGNSKLPTGSDVLTFVSTLEETRTVKYGSAINLQNGMVQLNFTEDGDSATKGNLELFKEFGLALRPFFGGEAYAINALLRYRINRNSGEIKFWFDLQRPDRVLEDASKELIEKIKTETGLTIIFGVAS